MAESDNLLIKLYSCSNIYLFNYYYYYYYYYYYKSSINLYLFQFICIHSIIPYTSNAFKAEQFTAALPAHCRHHKMHLSRLFQIRAIMNLVRRWRRSTARSVARFYPRQVRVEFHRGRHPTVQTCLWTDEEIHCCRSRQILSARFGLHVADSVESLKPPMQLDSWHFEWYRSKTSCWALLYSHTTAESIYTKQLNIKSVTSGGD